MNEGKNIVDLMDELKNMPEQIILQKIKHFRISLDIFDNNYKDLIHHLEIHNDPRTSLELMSIHNREMLHSYQKEITRFLHNYIASALSLTDHARIHYNDLYGDTELFPDYKTEIETRFTNNPLAVFVKNLRHYFQHYRIPGVSTSFKVRKNTQVEMTLILPLKEVHLYSRWDAAAKQFISSQKDDINLLDLVNKYHELIIDFYKWFLKRQYEIHKKDIEAVTAHTNKIRGLEVSLLLRQFVAKPKTAEELESDLYRMFHNDDLAPIKNAVTPADKIASILNLLSKTKPLQKEEIEALTKLIPPQ